MKKTVYTSQLQCIGGGGGWAQRGGTIWGYVGDYGMYPESTKSNTEKRIFTKLGLTVWICETTTNSMRSCKQLACARETKFEGVLTEKTA